MKLPSRRLMIFRALSGALVGLGMLFQYYVDTEPFPTWEKIFLEVLLLGILVANVFTRERKK